MLLSRHPHTLHQFVPCIVNYTRGGHGSHRFCVFLHNSSALELRLEQSRPGRNFAACRHALQIAACLMSVCITLSWLELRSSSWLEGVFACVHLFSLQAFLKGASSLDVSLYHAEQVKVSWLHLAERYVFVHACVCFHFPRTSVSLPPSLLDTKIHTRMKSVCACVHLFKPSPTNRYHSSNAVVERCHR